jgi:aspartate aminotransferase-like enzyme
VERAEDIPERGAYLDVVAYRSAFGAAQPTNTPAVPLLYALQAQLERIERDGGIEERWERHRAMRETVERWVSDRGADLEVGFLPDDGRRSWTVSCLTVPDGVSGRVVAKRLSELGWTIGSGYGPLKEATIRLGHMGDHTVAELSGLLGALEDVLVGEIQARSATV